MWNLCSVIAFKAFPPRTVYWTPSSAGCLVPKQMFYEAFA